MHTLTKRLSVITALLCLANLVHAQTDAKLPSGEQVFAKCVEAMGGKSRIKKVETVALQGVAEIPEMSLKGNVVVHYRGGELQAVANFDGAKTVQGITDSKGWELSPATGARLTSAVETQQLLGSITMNVYLEPEKMYKQIDNVGEELVDGEKCYRLKLIRREDGEAEEMFFSVATGLPTRAIAPKDTEFGKVTVVTTISDYKEVDHIQTAMKLSSHLEKLGVTYTVVFKSVKINEPIDDSAFIVPAAIKPLLAK